MVYAIIPAAGIGSRMQSSIPKQYLPLLDGNVLLYSIRALLALPEIRLLMIALHPADSGWSDTQALLTPDERARIQTCVGGAERWQSVQAALSALASFTQGDDVTGNDWVMVHDAVRPCVRLSDLRALMTACVSGSADGALLATPVADTLKKADSTLSVVSTIDRSQLWAACTPQMFRVGHLQHALQQVETLSAAITDEASALELCGAHPKLVACAKDNIKITYPEDLILASWIIKARQESESLTK